MIDRCLRAVSGDDEHVRLVIRKETYSKLVEVCGESVESCVDEIVDAVRLSEKLFEDLKKYMIERSGRGKHLRYAGGDWYIKDELLKIALKAPLKKGVFVEVFGGSGLMSQIIPRERFPNIVYNDIDRDLVSLHKLIKENPDLLTSILVFLPHSRYIHDYLKKNFGERDIGGIAGAVALFYLAATGIGGHIDSTFGTTKTRKSIARSLMSSIATIYDVAKKFRDVTIEQLDFEELIKRYDSENTLFYLDPPFLDSTETDRSDYYRHGFAIRDAVRLSNILRKIKGYFMLKIPEDNEQYYRTLPAVDRTEIKIKLSLELIREGKRREFKYLILTNYKTSSSKNLLNIANQQAK